MKPKQVVSALILLLCGGLGLYLFLRPHRASATVSDEEGSVPTLVSVQSGRIRPMTLHRYVTGYGTVMPAPATTGAPAADAPLAAPTAGVVATVDVVEGQQVHQGQLLLTLDSATITARYAAEEVARQKRLYGEHNTSQKMLQDAETQLALLQVRAPLAGTVTSVNVKPGAAVDLSTIVAEIMDLHRLVVTTGVPESDAALLRTGEPVQVLTRPPVAASVSYVSPTVDTTNGTIPVRAALPAGSGLHPGQYVALRIVTGTHAGCLAAPEDSVVSDINGRNVIALIQGDHAVQTPVQIGFREHGWVEVSGSGLKAGAAVVTVGAYGLPDNTRIQVVNPSGDAAAGPQTDANPAQ